MAPSRGPLRGRSHRFRFAVSLVLALIVGAAGTLLLRGAAVRTRAPVAMAPPDTAYGCAVTRTPGAYCPLDRAALRPLVEPGLAALASPPGDAAKR